MVMLTPAFCKVSQFLATIFFISFLDSLLAFLVHSLFCVLASFIWFSSSFQRIAVFGFFFFCLKSTVQWCLLLHSSKVSSFLLQSGLAHQSIHTLYRHSAFPSIPYFFLFHLTLRCFNIIYLAFLCYNLV